MYLSIIIPVYNSADYLRRCLDSVKYQSFTDYEALLIDDGSTVIMVCVANNST